ncbi:MAG: hypothetical protein JNG86_15925 [Verrucomicrobiaceae bacterium]|nr:hypothetical protein [Verrucomicrobiaceae bacterium]
MSTLAVTSSGDLLLGGPFFSVGPGLYGSVWSPFLAKADLPGSTLSAQETWRQTHFGTYDNTGGAADTADFDDDGLANLIEYAFALDPTQGGSRELPQAQMTGGNVVVSFPQPAGVTGVTYGVEWSATMAAGSWQAVSDTGTAPQHTFTIPVGVNTQIFVRLKVTSP